MTFSLRNLSVLAYANGFTLWHYKMAGGAVQAAETQGFFDDAGDMLAGGDMMMVSGREGARMLCVVASGEGLRVAPLN